MELLMGPWMLVAGGIVAYAVVVAMVLLVMRAGRHADDELVHEGSGRA